MGKSCSDDQRILMLNLTSYSQFLIIPNVSTISEHLHFAYLSDKTENILSQERKKIIKTEVIKDQRLFWTSTRIFIKLC